MSIDPVNLARTLIACPSVTPREAGALDVVQETLEGMGFAVTRLPFGDVDNLYARRGNSGPNFCFAGHTDVVPPGDSALWHSDPFIAEDRDGYLYGRGAADMKGGIAAFLAACEEVHPDHGSISLLITGDEEGDAVNGTVKVLEELARRGESFNHCLVGEPTNPARMGDEIKNGRRGSINTIVTVHGRQGHVAYPDRAENPVPVLINMINRLYARLLDDGVPGFPPSNLEVTSVDVGNPAHNVIPQTAQAKFNIRFNTAHTGKELERWIRETAAFEEDSHACQIDLDIRIMGEAFLTRPGPFTDLLQMAVEEETGRKPALTTGGGTSDARYIQKYAPVAEFGLVGESMHQANEKVRIEDIYHLANIYKRILRGYFAKEW